MPLGYFDYRELKCRHIKKSRKIHECKYCHNSIPIGSPYLNIAGIGYDDIRLGHYGKGYFLGFSVCENCIKEYKFDIDV